MLYSVLPSINSQWTETAISFALLRAAVYEKKPAEYKCTAIDAAAESKIISSLTALKLMAYQV